MWIRFSTQTLGCFIRFSSTPILCARSRILVLVDMGVGDYTRDIWNKNRYQIFSQRTAYHNLPLINGTEEQAGIQFCAEKMKCRMDVKCSEASLEMTKAYPETTGVESFCRVFSWNGAIK